MSANVYETLGFLYSAQITSKNYFPGILTKGIYLYVTYLESIFRYLSNLRFFYTSFPKNNVCATSIRASWFAKRKFYFIFTFV